MKEGTGPMTQLRSRHQVARDNIRRNKRPNQFERQPFNPNKKHNFGNHGGARNSQTARRMQYSNGPCHSCGRFHGNTPYLFQRECYDRRQQYHKCTYCPWERQHQPRVMRARQPQQPSPGETPQQGNQQRPLAQERVYPVTQEEVEVSKTVISGMLSLCDHKAYALFDMGATRSFVSTRFVQL